MATSSMPLASVLKVCFLLAFGCVVAQQQKPSSPLPDKSPWDQPPISADELQRLRPIVLPDLEQLLRRHYNETPSPADVENEFHRCEFTPVRLGTLGRAIVVEAQTGHGGGSNAALVNIYVPEGGSYRRIAEGMGFGPIVLHGSRLHGSRSVPDLAFGWSMGACHTTYSRYRYKKGKYTADACYQEDWPADGNDESCVVKRCEGHLPVFSDPALKR